MRKTKEDWAHFYRNTYENCPDRGQRTNNLVERSFLSLKNDVLKRRKCGNVTQLVEHAVVKLTKTFSQVIMAITFKEIGTMGGSFWDRLDVIAM